MSATEMVKKIQEAVGGSIRNGGTISTNTIVDLIGEFEDEGLSDEELVKVVIQEILDNTL